LRQGYRRPRSQRAIAAAPATDPRRPSWRGSVSAIARRDYCRGTFLSDRLGAAGVLDPTLRAVLLDLRCGLLATYGRSSAATMLIDQVVVAYQNFLRVTGWTGNTALMVEAEFFGRDKPSAQFRDRATATMAVIFGA
jgi:hypothetical protein